MVARRHRFCDSVPEQGVRGQFGDGMVLNRRGVLAGGAVAVALLVGAASAPPIPVPRPERVAEAAAVRAAAPDVRRYHTGVSGWILADLDTGAVVDAHEADRPFAPASVAKLPTAFFALDRLGPEHRFETRLMATGPVRDGRIEGDLILAGGGDPELDSDDLMALASALAGQGVRQAAGRFVVDGSAGPHLEAISESQPVEAAYNPALSGLSLNFNRVRLKWDARGKSRLLRLSATAEQTDPEVSGVRVALASTTNVPMFSYRQTDADEFWQMNPSGFRGEGARWLPVRRPERYAGEVFRVLGGERGIALAAAEPGTVPPGATTLAVHRSRELLPMLRAMLRHSTNITAELVGYAASRAGGAEVRTPAGSAAAMNAWASQVAGFPLGDEGFRLSNHSGLSTESRVSPRRLVELLTAVARREPASEAAGGLPERIAMLLKDYSVAAKSVDLDYKNLDIAAKTGTMDYVRGLAGYIVTPSGRRFAFAIFSNDIDRRPEGEIERIDERWMARAREFERGLIRSWVKRLES